MARLWTECSLVLVTFLMFACYLSASESDPSYYIYNVDLPPSIVKRDVSNQTAVAQPVPISDNRSNPASDASSMKTSVMLTDTKQPQPNPMGTVQTLQKNLGENGAGICKTCNSSVPAKSTEPAADGQKPNSIANIIVKSNQTDSGGEDDEISISKFSEPTFSFNKTLRQHNITETHNDSHIYYNSSFTVNPDTARMLWVDMDSRHDVKVNELLSKSHRRAATVKLSFDFPFYGHLVRNVTIATGGFLYTGEYVHSWLAATQYIAPLMANFDTSLSNDSFIKYVDNGTCFTVQWEEVSLQDKPNDGQFTFQVTLVNNGDIIFVYKMIPLIIENIQDDQHPVKVGLSDAYIIDRTIFFVRRKTIYEYHRVNFPKEDIKNWTVIHLKALPTCVENQDCETCLTRKIDNFQCTWCPSTNRCSNGLDRHRQDWLMKGCDQRKFINETQCSQPFPSYDHPNGNDFYYGSKHAADIDHVLSDTNRLNSTGVDNGTLDDSNGEFSGTLHSSFGRTRHVDDVGGQFDASMHASSRVGGGRRFGEATAPVKMGTSGVTATIFLIVLASGLAAWVTYAYRNPHSTSGQMLIRYRPSQWRFKRGEARYTAATIHM